VTVAAGPHNLRYLTTKRDRMGHDIKDLPELELATPTPPRVVPQGRDYGYAGIVDVDDVENA
jgi:hypothetical protein